MGWKLPHKKKLIRVKQQRLSPRQRLILVSLVVISRQVRQRLTKLGLMNQLLVVRPTQRTRPVVSMQVQRIVKATLRLQASRVLVQVLIQRRIVVWHQALVKLLTVKQPIPVIRPLEQLLTVGWVSSHHLLRIKTQVVHWAAPKLRAVSIVIRVQRYKHWLQNPIRRQLSWMRMLLLRKACQSMIRYSVMMKVFRRTIIQAARRRPLRKPRIPGRVWLKMANYYMKERWRLIKGNKISMCRQIQL